MKIVEPINNDKKDSSTYTTTTVVCKKCGHDTDKSAVTDRRNGSIIECQNCKQPLELKQSVSILVNALPPAFGGTM